MIEDRIVIDEMIDEENLYEVSFHGAAEDFGFSDQTDELSVEDAYEIAKEVSLATGSAIVWDCYKPGWA
tara:strand:- start:1300 stop:1506 length:207 start_codon:yes stop_codon:yes gene_type:complete